MSKTPYPWHLTKRQKETFEQICIGNDKGVNFKIANTLIKKSLIERQEQKIMNFSIYRYSVPIPIHMQWCSWCAENFDDDGNEL